MFRPKGVKPMKSTNEDRHYQVLRSKMIKVEIARVKTRELFDFVTEMHWRVEETKD